MPSSRWETERSRRVSRSTSAAEGMLSAPIAASWACTAFSRASKRAVERRVDHRVADQLLGDLAERLLALAGEAVDEALLVASALMRRQASSRRPLGRAALELTLSLESEG